MQRHTAAEILEVVEQIINYRDLVFGAVLLDDCTQPVYGNINAGKYLISAMEIIPVTLPDCSNGIHQQVTPKTSIYLLFSLVTE